MDLISLDSFELSPMQSGMLFQWMLGRSGATGAGYDIEQIHFELRETIDPVILGRAFTQVVRHHESLRAFFIWEGCPAPVQQLDVAPVVSVTTHDWRGLDDTQRGEARDEFLQRDRHCGFDLNCAPLMRVSVFDCGNDHTEIVWTVHHIVIDGRSFPTILQQAFAAYDALTLGQEVSLAEANKPYREFIKWQRQQGVSESLPFYRELLAGKQVSTPLPGVQSSAQLVPDTGYGRKSLEVSNRVLMQLQELAQRTGTTMGVALQAALALLLSRFTGDQDVLFGTVRSLRRDALNGDAENITGLLINTLPVRAQLNDDCSVAELLVQLQAQNRALRAHSHVSLIDIQGESEIPRGRPLFETLLMFDNQEINRTLRESGDSRWSASQVAVYEQPSLPLTFTVFHGERLEVRVLFDKRRFTEMVADRLALSFVTVLDRLSQNSTRRLGEIEAVTEDERTKIVQAWNTTARPFSDTLRIHELFERQVDIQPDAIAVDMDGATLSYLELERRANKLAHVLRTRGAGIGQYIGVCLDRNTDLVVALLAVAKSGSPYVPLDPQYPRDRLSFMVQDTAAVLVITKKSYEALFRNNVVLVDGDGPDEISASSDARLSPLGSSRDVCYAIFTSGSTGNPKGVVLCHHAVVNTLDWVTRSYGIGPSDRLLFVTSHCFDLSVYDVFGVLGAGGTIVIASSALLEDPQALTEAIGSRKITIWDSAPAALQRLVPFFPEAMNTSLRLVMLSGDWIPLALPDALRVAFPGVKVKSMGGATEAAIWSNFFHIEEVDPQWISIPYGKPIQNSAYYVLDAGLRPVPIGVSGDLYIGGVCLAEGYLNRPELTLERFIPNHLSTQAGERLYKTGDLARYWSDGNLEFLGRTDFQVKIRGYRVEVGEVEVALLALQHVRDAICTTWVDGVNQKSLVAYVVPESGFQLDAGSIKANLASKLPDFMVPSFVMLLDSLPVSSNGKLDRKALPSPSVAIADDKYQPAVTELQLSLVEIWQEVLQRKPIGIADNFFDTGGHSLLAVALMAQLKNRLQIKVPLSRIIEHPTIERFAASLSTIQGPKNVVDHSLIELRPGGTRRMFWVHDGDGEVLLYRTLSQQLPSEFTVLGVSPRALTNVPMLDRTVPDMAATYLEQVRICQPHGPYYFGGLCAGGVIAYEMAVQLESAGESVALVVILDAIEPRMSVGGFIASRRRWKRMVDLYSTGTNNLRPIATLRQFARRVWNIIKFESVSKLMSLSVATRLRVLDIVQAHGWTWPNFIPSLSVRHIYLAAKALYQPRTLHTGRVAVMRAEEGGDPDDPDINLLQDSSLGWGRVVAGRLDALQVQGGHSSMLQEPNVNYLAKQISDLLSETSNSSAS